MGLSNCCCVTGTCSRSTSVGLAVIPVWKGDSTGPVEGRPHCTLYRTLTITIAADAGPVHCVAVTTGKFQHGASDVTGVNAQLILESLVGGKPAGTFTLGAIVSRVTNGFTRYYDLNGLRDGTVSYLLSNPITLTEVEDTARMLSALVDWPALAQGAHQLVKYQAGIVVTSPVNYTACNFTGGEAGGLFTAGGISSAINYHNHVQPVEFNTGGILSGLSFPASGSQVANMPCLKLHAYAWRSRLVTIPGWRRVNYYEVRGSPVGACQYKNSAVAVGFNACVIGVTEAPSLTGGTVFEAPPSVPDTSTFIQC